MSLLTIVQDTCDTLSIPRPATVAASTDQQVRQLFALANEEGADLAGSYDWQALRVQKTFTTVAAEEQTSAIPTDIDHFIANSFFNRTTVRPLMGPITPQLWQAILAQPQLNTPYLTFIEREGKFLVTPTPAAGETIAYEYISINWAKDVNDVPKDSFTADTDTTYLDERLIKLGLRWRFLSAKGLDYAEAMATYEREKQIKQARDGGNRMISSTGQQDYYWGVNIPLGNWPG